MSQLQLRLAALRARKRLSQRRLAAVTGLRPDTISALERGQTRGMQFETLARLCEALDCHPGELFAIETDDHAIPVLGDPDEDALIAGRLRDHDAGNRIDGPTFVAELLRLANDRGPQTRA